VLQHPHDGAPSISYRTRLSTADRPGTDALEVRRCDPAPRRRGRGCRRALGQAARNRACAVRIAARPRSQHGRRVGVDHLGVLGVRAGGRVEVAPLSAASRSSITENAKVRRSSAAASAPPHPAGEERGGERAAVPVMFAARPSRPPCRTGSYTTEGPPVPRRGGGTRRVRPSPRHDTPVPASPQ